jgi:hydrogenase-4 membrane subunit HyfE
MNPIVVSGPFEWFARQNGTALLLLLLPILVPSLIDKLLFQPLFFPVSVRLLLVRDFRRLVEVLVRNLLRAEYTLVSLQVISYVPLY